MGIHPEAAVKPTDRLVGVNGASTLGAMELELGAMQVDLRIARYPAEFKVTIVKQQGRKLGLRFDRPGNPHFPELRVTGLSNDGLVMEHNQHKLKSKEWHAVVLPDMRINRVNEIAGDAGEIAAELKLAR